MVEATSMELCRHPYSPIVKVGALAQAVQEETGQQVEVAFVDQGYTCEEATTTPEVVKLPEAKGTLCCCPGGGGGCSSGWMARFRRSARDYERLPETVVGLHLVALVFLLRYHAVSFLTRGA